jgi:hypothetical protein
MKRHSDGSFIIQYSFRGLQGFLIGFLIWTAIAVISDLTLSYLVKQDEKCYEQSVREMLANQSLDPAHGCVPPIILESLVASTTGPGFLFLPSTYPHFLSTQVLSGLIIGVVGALILMIFKSRRMGLVVILMILTIMLTLQSFIFHIIAATG